MVSDTDSGGAQTSGAGELANASAEQANAQKPHKLVGPSTREREPHESRCRMLCLLISGASCSLPLGSVDKIISVSSLFTNQRQSGPLTIA